MNSDNTIMLYGVNLRRIKKRLKLPSEVCSEDYPEYEIHLEKLKKLANPRGLVVLVNDKAVPRKDTDLYEIEAVHVGVRIRPELSPQLGSYEAPRFELNQLNRDTSELIGNLNEIGIDAGKNNLYLYVL